MNGILYKENQKFVQNGMKKKQLYRNQYCEINEHLQNCQRSYKANPKNQGGQENPKISNSQEKI